MWPHEVTIRMLCLGPQRPNKGNLGVPLMCRWGMGRLPEAQSTNLGSRALCSWGVGRPHKAKSGKTLGARLVQVGDGQAAGGDVHIEHFDVQQALWRRRLPAIWHDVEGHAVGVHQHAAQHLRTRPLGSMRNCICSECVTHCFSTAHKLKERGGMFCLQMVCLVYVYQHPVYDTRAHMVPISSTGLA